MMLSLLGNPLILKLAMMILEAWAKKKEMSAKEKEAFDTLGALLEKNGVKVARSAYESARRQEAELATAWDAEKAQDREAAARTPSSPPPGSKPQS